MRRIGATDVATPTRGPGRVGLNRLLAAWIATLALAGLVAGGAAAEHPGSVSEREAALPVDDDLARTAEGREFYADRAFPAARVPAVNYFAGLRQAELAHAGHRPGGERRWRALGPHRIEPRYDPIYQGRGPISGRVHSVAPHPSNAAVVYVGTATGGVWRTTNDGRSWQPLSDRLPSLGIGAVAIDPTDPRRVYAGTGSADTAPQSPLGVGLFRSDDGGRSWQQPAGAHDPFRACFFSDIVVSRTGVVLSAAHEGALAMPAAVTAGPRCARPGIWRSTDRGRSWAPALAGVVDDIAVDPSNPRVLYAAAALDGVYKSSDSGATWTRLVVGPPPGLVVTRARVAVAQSDPKRLYAAFARHTGDLLGVWTSADAGGTWVLVPHTEQPCNYSKAIVDIGQCWYDFALEVDPRNPSSFYVGGILLQRWELGQHAPATIGEGARGIHVDQHALIHDSRNRLWIGNDGGVYRTTDRGRTFTNLNTTLAITQFNHGISGSVSGPLIGGSQDNGTAMFRTATQWPGVLGGDGGATALSLRAPRRIFGSYQNLQIMRSTNGGQTWRDANFGIVPNEPRAFYAPLEMSPHDPNTLFAGTRRVYRTSNAGDLWLPISPYLDGNVRAIGTAVSEERTLYAATPTGIWVTRDGGAAWSRCVTCPPSRVVTSIAVEPRDAAVAHVTLSGYGTPHVFSTTDYGVTWTASAAGLPDTPANAIAIDARHRRLYVGTDLGIFSRSATGGWRSEQADLPRAVVTDILVDDTARTLIVATYGRGMFAAKVSD